MDIRLKSAVAAVVSLASLIASPIYAAQAIAPPLQSEILYVAPSQAISIPVNYSASSPEGNKEVGLGLRVHFDSSKISFTSLSQSLQSGIQPIGDVQNDTNNVDNDINTDKFFVVAWVDIAGNWPGDNSVFPLELFTGDFTANNNFSGSTKVMFTASSTSGGAIFNATPQTICRKPEVSLSGNVTSIMEGGSLSFNVVLDQALPIECGAFSTTLSVGGAATANNDYQAFNTEAIFLPGEVSAPVTITTLDDSLVETNESLDVNIVAGNNYSLSSTLATQLSLNINSNDMSLDLSISSASVAETDNNASSTITVVRAGYLDTVLDVAYQISGTATQGQDFSLSDTTNTLHFNAGQSTASLDITVLSDSNVEGDETVVFSLLSSGNYQLPQNSLVALTIKDAAEKCIDIDGNGTVDALTDGIILTRYLLGYRNDNLIANSFSVDATRTTATTVQSHIESHLQSGCFDIDGNNDVDALTDGVLLIRYLSDYQGDSLITGAIGENATRITASSVSAYIGTLVSQ